ncbi:hypothetical protein BSMD_008520 [Bacillus subtilis Miyagi-4]|nr:hypothetical protein BSMD_008520 [Bacillus subtilis Miyagi-4]
MSENIQLYKLFILSLLDHWHFFSFRIIGATHLASWVSATGSI